MIWEKWNHASAACVFMVCVSHSKGEWVRQNRLYLGGIYRSKFYRVVRHKSWYLLFSSTKTLFIHSFSVIFSRCNHVTLVKIQASWQEGTPCLPASFKSVNHRRPLSPFWQISSSYSIGCGILLSVFFWHGREGRTRVPCCCNYITASLAAPSPVAQLFLENINFIVSFEIMRPLSHNKSLVEDRAPTVWCMRGRIHNVSGMALTDWEGFSLAVYFHGLPQTS